MVRWLQSEPELVAEIRGAYSPESLPPWPSQLESTTKEQPTMGKEVPPTTTTTVEEDDAIAEGTLPEGVGTVGDAEGVGSSVPSPPMWW